jgi:hypothetical protein
VEVVAAARAAAVVVSLWLRWLWHKGANSRSPKVWQLVPLVRASSNKHKLPLLTQSLLWPVLSERALPQRVPKLHPLLDLLPPLQEVQASEVAAPFEEEEAEG